MRNLFVFGALPLATSLAALSTGCGTSSGSDSADAGGACCTNGAQGNPGPQGSAGPQGMAGPQGSAGPAGPSGITALNHVEHRWGGSQVICGGVWVTVPGSQFNAQTNGGALLVSSSALLASSGGGDPLVACRVTIDGRWAGDFSGIPNAGSIQAPDGYMYAAGGITMWSQTRQFSGVPAGMHAFAFQCNPSLGPSCVGVGFGDAQPAMNSLGFVELP